MQSLQRQRILVQCLRWAREDDAFVADLAAAWLRRHPLAPAAAELSVRIVDEQGRVIYDDDAMDDDDARHGVKREREDDQESESKRQRRYEQAVHSLYTTIWPSGASRELVLHRDGGWAAGLNEDVKSHILDLLVDMSEGDAPMTRFFSLLAVQFVNRADVRPGQQALQRRRPGPVKPSFMFIARLVGEDASPALLAWALWLYTGSHAPAALLLPDELAQLAYEVVKYDRPLYLDALFWGYPLRLASTASREAYGHLFHVLIPLALVQARHKGWEQCHVMQWVIQCGGTLDKLPLFTRIGGVEAYTVQHGKKTTQINAAWTFHGSTWRSHWSSYVLDENYLELTDDFDAAEAGIPLAGLQWLRARQIVEKTKALGDAFEFDEFLSVVRVTTVPKARFLFETWKLPGDFMGTYINATFALLHGMEPSTRIDILSVLCRASKNPVWMAFVTFITSVIDSDNFDEETAHVLWLRMRHLLDVRSDQDAYELCATWIPRLRGAESSVVLGVCVLVREFVRRAPKNATSVLVHFFHGLWGKYGTDVDGAFVQFVQALRGEVPDIQWRAVLNQLQDGTYNDVNSVSVLCLPLTTETVKSFL